MRLGAGPQAQGGQCRPRSTARAYGVIAVLGCSVKGFTVGLGGVVELGRTNRFKVLRSGYVRVRTWSLMQFYRAGSRARVNKHS